MPFRGHDPVHNRDFDLQLTLRREGHCTQGSRHSCMEDNHGDEIYEKTLYNEDSRGFPGRMRSATILQLKAAISRPSRPCLSSAAPPVIASPFIVDTPIAFILLGSTSVSGPAALNTLGSVGQPGQLVLHPSAGLFCAMQGQRV